ncbi:unnamed protein product, partial [Clonostachys rosea f. rosea IK726]|uniref:Uncharacterized protein n=2 Tax=Bionectria ochroleuca TaxID=29856 RepID=A0A0B7JJP3_BIOOC
MSRTILEELTASNPPVNAQFVPISGNTTSEKWLKFTSWRPWADFTYRNLSSMYRGVLDLESQAPNLGPGPTLPMEQTIRDERSMDHYLPRFILPVVNWALHQSTPALGLIRLQIAPGSWVDYSDWALVSQDDLEENCV